MIPTPRRWVRVLAVLVLLGVLVSACGPLGDDDDDPTPTAPAVPGADAPAGQLASPAATPAATPRAVAGAGTPRVASPPTEEAEEESEPTETPDDAADDDEAESTEVADEETPAADDEAPPADDESEPTEEVDPTAVVVADCEEPEELPERTGRQNRVVAEEGLRLRSGPGTSCDEITSLSIDTPVRVISGVVEAEGDENEWVKVDVDGTEGWVAVEFLANPPEE